MRTEGPSPLLPFALASGLHRGGSVLSNVAARAVSRELVSNEHAAAPDRAQSTILLSTPHCTVEARCRRDAADDARTVVVSVSGEVDLDNADDVHAVLQTLVERRPSRIDIELDRLEFIDSFGVGRLIMAQQAALASGVVLSLRRLRPTTRRVFVIAGLETFLNVV